MLFHITLYTMVCIIATPVAILLALPVNGEEKILAGSTSSSHTTALLVRSQTSVIGVKCATNSKKKEDYDSIKWKNMKTKKRAEKEKAVCSKCAAKLECSVCKEWHAPDQLKSFSKGKIHLCGKCEGLGHGPRALETHRCGHCSFAGAYGKFDQDSIKNASRHGSPKKCLQCKPTRK